MSASSSSLLRATPPFATSPARYPSSFRNPSLLPIISRRNIKSCILGTGQGLQFLSTVLGDLSVSKTHLWDMAADVSCAQPAPLVPSDFFHGSGDVWIAVNILGSVILPFLGFKCGSLMKLKSEVDTADEVVETIERAAMKVQDLAEKIADHLPADGKLKDAVTFIKNSAKEIAKDAHLVDEVIHKVKEMEEKIESISKPANEMPTKVNSQQK